MSPPIVRMRVRRPRSEASPGLALATVPDLAAPGLRRRGRARRRRSTIAESGGKATTVIAKKIEQPGSHDVAELTRSGAPAPWPRSGMKRAPVSVNPGGERPIPRSASCTERARSSAAAQERLRLVGRRTTGRRSSDLIALRPAFSGPTRHGARRADQALSDARGLAPLIRRPRSPRPRLQLHKRHSWNVDGPTARELQRPRRRGRRFDGACRECS